MITEEEEEEEETRSHVFPRRSDTVFPFFVSLLSGTERFHVPERKLHYLWFL